MRVYLCSHIYSHGHKEVTTCGNNTVVRQYTIMIGVWWRQEIDVCIELISVFMETRIVDIYTDFKHILL